MRRHADNNVFICLAFTGDLEKEKRRLQNILATGKDEVEDEMKQVFVRKKAEETAEPDRFEECTSSCPQEGGRQEAWEASSLLELGWQAVNCHYRGATKPSFQEKGLAAVTL